MNHRISVVIFLLMCSIGHAETYDDCVLNGMKGVSSDTAARLVAQACRNKIEQAKTAKISSFGIALNDGEYRYFGVGKDGVQKHDDGYVSQTLKNVSQYKTITYLALAIKDGDFYAYKSRGNAYDDYFAKQNWEKERSKTYYYKLALKPNSEVQILFRKPKTDSFYPEVITVLGRESKWSDSVTTSAFSSNVKPEQKDPLE